MILILHTPICLLVLHLDSIEALSYWPFCVATPIGEVLLVRHVYESCVIIIVDKETLADLIVLEPLELDIILGMD